MSLNSIKYTTTGEINWDALQPCRTSQFDREDDAYVLFSNKKDLSERDRERLFYLLDAQACYNYAMNVVGGRWEKGERKILENTDFSYLYALNVIKGRWEDAEDEISGDFFVALAYAKNVVKGRFRKAERRLFNKKYTLSFRKGSQMVNEMNHHRCFLQTEDFIGWHRYEGFEARDVYVAELFGERNEEFEKKVMRIKASDKERWFLLSRYTQNCCPTVALPKDMHEFMLRGGLEKNEDALEYCKRFEEDWLKAQTLGFAPAPAKKPKKENPWTEDRKERLAELVKKSVEESCGTSVCNCHMNTHYAPGSQSEEFWSGWVSAAESFLRSVGCSVSQRRCRRGKWTTTTRKSTSLVWVEYEKEWCSYPTEYWAGVPKALAEKALADGKFPVSPNPVRFTTKRGNRNDP